MHEQCAFSGSCNGNKGIVGRCHSRYCLCVRYQVIRLLLPLQHNSTVDASHAFTCEVKIYGAKACSSSSGLTICTAVAAGAS
jgi:hypothetical protein